MPIKITKTTSDRYRVSTPGGTKAKATSRKKAEAQRKLLNAIDHGFVPRKGGKR